MALSSFASRGSTPPYQGLGLPKYDEKNMTKSTSTARRHVKEWAPILGSLAVAGVAIGAIALTVFLYRNHIQSNHHYTNLTMEDTLNLMLTHRVSANAALYFGGIGALGGVVGAIFNFKTSCDKDTAFDSVRRWNSQVSEAYEDQRKAMNDIVMIFESCQLARVKYGDFNEKEQANIDQMKEKLKTFVSNTLRAEHSTFGNKMIEEGTEKLLFACCDILKAERYSKDSFDPLPKYLGMDDNQKLNYELIKASNRNNG